MSRIGRMPIAVPAGVTVEMCIRDRIADKLGLDHAGMYKTITTVGKSGGYYVFVVPIDDEIDFSILIAFVFASFFPIILSFLQ